MTKPFWKTKPLAAMSATEWESLCDGCGRCCLNKLEEEITRKLFFTDVGCRLLDGETCRCRDYANRQDVVEDCLKITPKDLAEIDWLPPSCGYRLIAEGKDLYWWHPLVSGDPDTVHAAGVSVRGRMSGTENEIPDEELEDHIVRWPGQIPKRARARRKSRT
ncbi:MAG TPA: YcgN family cysteine cluster protein [Xanthobacteraceae bacterium]